MTSSLSISGVILFCCHAPVPTIVLQSEFIPLDFAVILAYDCTWQRLLRTYSTTFFRYNF
jgi:hypothetical protein